MPLAFAMVGMRDGAAKGGLSDPVGAVLFLTISPNFFSSLVATVLKLSLVLFYYSLLLKFSLFFTLAPPSNFNGVIGAL